MTPAEREALLDGLDHGRELCGCPKCGNGSSYNHCARDLINRVFRAAIDRAYAAGRDAGLREALDAAGILSREEICGGGWSVQVEIENKIRAMLERKETKE